MAEPCFVCGEVPSRIRSKTLAEHRIEAEWRDCVVACTCGWRGAERTMGKAKPDAATQVVCSRSDCEKDRVETGECHCSVYGDPVPSAGAAGKEGRE